MKMVFKTDPGPLIVEYVTEWEDISGVPIPFVRGPFCTVAAEQVTTDRARELLSALRGAPAELVDSVLGGGQ